MRQLRKYLDKMGSVSDADWEFFISKLQQRSFPKKAHIINRGEVENHVSFIEKGIVRLYIPNENKDKEITFGFSFENEFISAYDSFLSRQPSKFSLQTLLPTKMWSINYEELQHVYKRTKIGNAIGRYYAERLFMIKSEREQALLLLSAEQRYRNLFLQRPNLFKEIPLKFLASYIGVTPQALSRIRKRI